MPKNQSKKKTTASAKVKKKTGVSLSPINKKKKSSLSAATSSVSDSVSGSSSSTASSKKFNKSRIAKLQAPPKPSISPAASPHEYASSPWNQRRGSFQGAQMLTQGYWQFIDRGKDETGLLSFQLHMVDYQGWQWNQRLFNSEMSDAAESMQHKQPRVREIVYTDLTDDC